MDSSNVGGLYKVKQPTENRPFIVHCVYDVDGVIAASLRGSYGVSVYPGPFSGTSVLR